MTRIIREIEQEICCNKCQIVLGFKFEDLRFDDQFGGGCYIKCPKCTVPIPVDLKNWVNRLDGH